MLKIVSCIATAMLSTVAFAADHTNSTKFDPLFNERQLEEGTLELGFNFDRRGTYFDWGRGMDGYGYCYQYASNGSVLNEGQPVSNHYCEAVRPSYVDWGRGMDGYGYCYQYTGRGVTMNKGQPVSNHYCERRSPSFFRWGRGMNGHTYCYQYTAKGVTMNKGQPVSNSYCY